MFSLKELFFCLLWFRFIYLFLKICAQRKDFEYLNDDEIESNFFCHISVLILPKIFNCFCGQRKIVNKRREGCSEKPFLYCFKIPVKMEQTRISCLSTHFIISLFSLCFCRWKKISYETSFTKEKLCMSFGFQTEAIPGMSSSYLLLSLCMFLCWLIFIVLFNIS